MWNRFFSLVALSRYHRKKERRRRKNSFRFVIWLRRLICVRKEGWKSSPLSFLSRNILEYRCKYCLKSFCRFIFRCIGHAILKLFRAIAISSYFAFFLFLFLRDPTYLIHWNQFSKRFSLIRISPNNLIVFLRFGTFNLKSSMSQSCLN